MFFCIISIIPIKIKSTAPVDVVPSSPKLITAPFDGVVKNIVINNNDKIIVGDLVVLLEDLDLTNEYNLAQQSLQIAEKELLRSRQSSFSDKKEKARLAELVAQVDLKKAELKNYPDEIGSNNNKLMLMLVVETNIHNYLGSYLETMLIKIFLLSRLKNKKEFRYK